MKTFIKLKTACIVGLEVYEVGVEVNLSSGLPGLYVIGLAGKIIAESRERVRCCLSLMGIPLPPKRIVVNLTPANLTKDGSHYDLPIALGILACLEVIDANCLENFVCLGEISLDGKVNHVAGITLVALYTKKHNLGLLCPASCEEEALQASQRNLLCAGDLSSFVRQLAENGSTSSMLDEHVSGHQPEARNGPDLHATCGDFDEIYGQEPAKRAIEIAIAGRHNLLMIGRPGSGKSMLAARIPSIMPPLATEEALEVSGVYSVSTEHRDAHALRPPFRAPHHSCSTASLVGGGKVAAPGEITLAHNGILFLDELAEFSSSAIESMRQPIETGEVSIARADYRICYPARFQLIAAMNPCKCGYFSDKFRECSRAPLCSQDYIGRLSGPIMERIDLHIFVNPPESWPNFEEKASGKTSAEMLANVMRARNAQRERFLRLTDDGAEAENASSNLERRIVHNAHLSNIMLRDFCKLEPKAEEILRKASDRFALSIREYHKTIKVARTIADLESRENIDTSHILQAIQMRPVATSGQRRRA